MDRWRNRLDTERAAKTGCQPPSSSDYSTCSDNPDGFSTRQKIPLAQQTSEDTLDEIDYSVNILDQNIDTEDNDVFTDCQDSFFSKTRNTTECTQLERTQSSNSRSNNSILSETQNTSEYAQSEMMSKFLNPRSNNQNYSKQLNLNESIEQETKNSRPYQMEEDSLYFEHQLVTIMEETEVSHRSNSLIRRNSSSNKPFNFPESQVNRPKGCNKDKTPSGILKKVLFVDDSEATDKSRVKKRDKNCSLLGKGRCCIWNTDENRNNHNTTESFILWEKLCNLQSSELIESRKSKSFSELNSLNESYGGDDELSESLRTLDDFYLSKYSINFETDEKLPEKKSIRPRTKSCDSILQEVKHLPHIFYAKYDAFLKGLSDEIRNIRKQNVVCTCNTSDKHINKENNCKSYKASVPVIKVSSEKDNERKIDRKKPVLPSKVSSTKVVMNLEKPSLEIFENSFQNTQRSPKEKSVTPVKVRKLYPWEKEVVSPVAEYIRGKRPSPFKNSPNKKI